MKHLKIAISVIFLMAITALAVQINTRSITNQKLKKDYAELNHLKYGLFSVEAWKDQLQEIITEEIDMLNLINPNRTTLKKHLEVQLGILIDKVYARIENKHKKSRIKLAIMDFFIDVDDIKKGIPNYAEAILKELSSSNTEKQIKRILKNKINHYLKETLDVKNELPKEKIITSYGMPNEESAKDKILDKINRNHVVIADQALLIIILVAILFILEGFTHGPLQPIQYLNVALVLMVLLILGVTTPMIDLEAKISELSFILFDHPVTFKNQVIYFQSKSILDVFKIMINHQKPEMKFVGVLLINFSIVFPVMKILSSLVYYYNFHRSRSSKLIQFFVLKAGKWSMADVVVVAIFMAYIGFNGIVGNQLGKLEDTANMELITTNGTSLQPGYYLFIAYTLGAMFLSNFVKNRPYIK